MALNMDDYEKALDISTKAHWGQKDKAGSDYILHPLKVSSMVMTTEEKIVALLHDVVEDTGITLENLREYGFKEEIIEAIDAITKRKGESYHSYPQRVADNSLAKMVKLADMKHNSDVSRYPDPTEEDVLKCNHYKKKIEELLKMN